MASELQARALDMTEADDKIVMLLGQLTQQLQIDAGPAFLECDLVCLDMLQRDKLIHQFKRHSDRAVCQVTQHAFRSDLLQASAPVKLALLRSHSTEHIAVLKKQRLDFAS